MEQTTFVGHIENIIAVLFKLDRNKVYEFIIKEHIPKRTKAQNRLCWELCTLIANATRNSKEDVYFMMLKAYGQGDMFAVRKQVKLSHYFKYYEVKYKGVQVDEVVVYRGTSTYDKKEMSIMLDGLIQECTNLGIPTYSDEEVQAMLEKWYG